MILQFALSVSQPFLIGQMPNSEALKSENVLNLFSIDKN